MESRLYEFLMTVLIFGVIFITGFIMPDAVRKDICFGIRIPDNGIDEDAVKSAKSDYRKRYLVSCGMYMIIVLAAAWYNYSEWFMAVAMVIFILLLYINYYISYRNMKHVKENAGRVEHKEYVIVDTDFRNKKNKIRVSPLWFLIPFGFAIADFISGIVFYPSIPQKVAVHWNIAGTPDGFVEKSYRTVMQMPVNLVVITSIMYIAYWFVKRAKQQTDTKNSSESIQRNVKFRYASSAYIAGISIAVAVIESMSYCKATGILAISRSLYEAVYVLFMIAVMVSTLLLIVLVGQGGSRLKLGGREKKVYTGQERNDDQLWKMGLFYYNPADPSIMVEKRFGIGWTINFGNKAALVGFIVLIAAVIFCSIFMTL